MKISLLATALFGLVFGSSAQAAYCGLYMGGEAKVCPGACSVKNGVAECGNYKGGKDSTCFLKLLSSPAVGECPSHCSVDNGKHIQVCY